MTGLDQSEDKNKRGEQNEWNEEKWRRHWNPLEVCRIYQVKKKTKRTNEFEKKNEDIFSLFFFFSVGWASGW